MKLKYYSQASAENEDNRTEISKDEFTNVINKIISGDTEGISPRYIINGESISEDSLVNADETTMKIVETFGVDGFNISVSPWTIKVKYQQMIGIPLIEIINVLEKL